MRLPPRKLDSATASDERLLWKRSRFFGGWLATGRAETPISDTESLQRRGTQRTAVESLDSTGITTSEGGGSVSHLAEMESDA